MKKDELDAFWDIDALLPRSRQMPRSRNTDAVEIDVPSLDGESFGSVGAVRIPTRPFSPSVPPAPPVPPRPMGEGRGMIGGRSVENAVGKSVEKTVEKHLEKTVGNAEVRENNDQPNTEITVETTVEAETVVHSVAPVGEIPIRRVVDPDAERRRMQAPKPEEEYEPSCALIHRVRIYRWKSSYQYYEAFVQTAEKLQMVHGEPCPHVRFFSYVPQYSQMGRAEMAWYLWFRDCARRGEYLETDYSYILLYVYEMINLPATDPAAQRDQLLGLWLHYREVYRQLDSYLPEWICDYSLIHHLPPPEGLDRRAIAALMQHCSLKEFYVDGGTEDGYLRALFAFCSNHDYRKSKYCTEANRPLFDRVMTEVLRSVTQRLSGEGKLFSHSGLEDSQMTRDAFSGALCSYRMKRKIEVSYCSFSRSHELRFLITDILKYTENKIRAYLGVRSRLSIYALPTNIRAMVDECVAAQLPRRRAEAVEKKQESEAAYAHFYDAPQAPLSLSNAAEIERLSWDTTQRLVDAFESDENAEKAELSTHGVTISETEPAENAPNTSAESVPTAEPSALSADEASSDHPLAPYADFLRAVLDENSAEQSRIARMQGKMPDALADAINEIAADALGDVLLEDTGDGYRVIEDYLDWMESAL